MIELSYIFRYVDPETEPCVYAEILKLADQQWNILREMGNKKLDIYRDAEDKKLVSQFVDLIQKEKELRERMPPDKIPDLPEFRKIISERTGLYKTIFDYTPNDRQDIRKIAQEKARELMERGPKKKKILVKCGIIGATIGLGLAGAGIGIHFYRNRNHKRKKEKR
ncbi:MAG: hypothetical protein AB1643_02740 [Patescibacteria group bacterium]